MFYIGSHLLNSLLALLLSKKIGVALKAPSKYQLTSNPGIKLISAQV